jgi:hypothetical protein
MPSNVCRCTDHEQMTPCMNDDFRQKGDAFKGKFEDH